MNRTYLWLSLFVLAIPLVPSFAEEEEVTKEQVDALVARLVSPNSPPVIRHSPSAKYPQDFDHEAQVRVHQAFKELYRLGIRSFPHIFDHFDDRRYSLTMDSGEADRNWTVGQLCFDIVTCHLQPYGPIALSEKKRSNGMRRGPQIPFYSARLHNPVGAKWWTSRKDKSLRELQIEVLEWVIDEEDKSPEKFSDRERDARKAMLLKLQDSESPLKPKSVFAK